MQLDFKIEKDVPLQTPEDFRSFLLKLEVGDSFLVPFRPGAFQQERHASAHNVRKKLKRSGIPIKIATRLEGNAHRVWRIA